MDFPEDLQSVILTFDPNLRPLWFSPNVTNMDRYVDFAYSWMGNLIYCLAWMWIIYRGSQVLSKPTEELIALLGIETPIAPTLSLAGIKADGIVLHWKSAEQKGSTIRHSLYVNGVKVGDISPQDSSIAVTGLLPDHGYIVRIFAVNALNFVAPSEEILIQTKPASTGDFYSTQDETSGDMDGSGPKVKPYMPLLETVTPSQSITPIQREHSGSISHSQKRFARRQTNPGPETHSHPSREESMESSEDIRELTERLDKIRAEKDSYENQMKIEEDSFKLEEKDRQKALIDVQQQNRDRNDETRKLNQRVRALESEELAARKKQNQVDKQLSQVTQEREKIKNDLTKWESEADNIEERIKQIAKEEEDYKEDSAKEVADLKQKLSMETATNKNMEETIRHMMSELKDLEEETKRIDAENVADDVLAAEAENEWRLHMNDMGNHYVLLQNQLAATRGANQIAQNALDHWKTYYYTHQAAQAYPQHVDMTLPRRDSLQRRAPSLRDERSPPTSHAEMPTSSTYAGSSMTGVSPNFGVISPFFNITNGMTIPPSSLPMSPDVDQLTGGAPTSPSAADGLLPSGLFGDDTESRFDESSRHIPLSLGAIDAAALHGNPNILPGLGAPETLEELNHGGPSSPASIQSRSQSASAFTSPQQSLTHLPQYSIESDRRSIRSTRSTQAAGGKFSNFFHLGRQRGKPGSDEGPALGSLKASESTSIPQQELDESMLHGIDGRRGSHSGGDDGTTTSSGPSWMGQMLGRANTSASLDQTIAGPPKRRFGVFPAKTDPWLGSGRDQTTDSPRPQSTASLDANTLILPRPGVDAQKQSVFGWPSVSLFGSSAAETLPGSSSSNLVGTDWSVSGGRGWTSRLHSRASSSVGQQNLTGLTLGQSSDDTDLLMPSSLNTQAPIGTRPRSAHVSTGSVSSTDQPSMTSTPPKLNPNAPSFRLFGSAASSAAPGGSSKRSKLRPRPLSPSNKQIEDALDSPLPPLDSPLTASSRRSRDGAASMVSSVADVSDAGRESIESGGKERETFMQKVARKSSQGLGTLTLPGRKGGKGGKSRKVVTEEEETGVTLTIEGATDDDHDEPVSGKDEKTQQMVGSPSTAQGKFRFRNLRRRKGDKNANTAANAKEQQGIGEGEDEETAVADAATDDGKRVDI